MAQLDAVQVYALAREAGLPRDAAIIATAIAKGESGHRTDAVGDTSLTNATWGPSIGLWQVRSLRSHTGTGKARDGERLANPTFNAESMATISNGGRNWSPWTVYKTGAYRQHLPEARAAAGTAGEDPPAADGGGSWLDDLPVIGDDIEAGRRAVGTVGTALGLLTSGETWIRVAQVLGGGVAIVLGVVLISRELVGNVAGELVGDVIADATGGAA